MTIKEAQLQKELDNALKALEMTRDKLIEAQCELRKLHWLLVGKEEGKNGSDPR